MGAPLGNQNGAKAKRWSAAISRALERRHGVGLAAQQKALDELAEKFIAAVESGDKDAMPGFRELGDRLEGKATEKVELSGGEEPIRINLTEQASMAERIRRTVHGVRGSLAPGGDTAGRDGGTSEE